ncbi:MAG: hypothetical protein RI894_2627 [Bacteroidota bacterium]|jgi:uncharacterized membrane protein
MDDNQEKINQLLAQLAVLEKKQGVFAQEIDTLRHAILALNPNKQENQTGSPLFAKSTPPQAVVATPPLHTPPLHTNLPRPPSTATPNTPLKKSEWEKFIGENLINKIGIIITVIGVAIGAKYSIEHDLISPLTRIILGYLMGVGLLGVGMKLKGNYENYSAVLVGGAMAIFYFITFSAYSFYGLLPQLVAFAMMTLFTGFTVFAAIHYDKVIIAHFGLVGAYTVPFLLSDGSNNAGALFAYMSIINLGILIIAFRKYWKSLYYAAFSLTWLIVGAWYFDSYSAVHFTTVMLFLPIFFLTFYGIFLAYKLLQKEQFVSSDSILLITNSFIFYGISCDALSENHTGNELLGLFTLCNAALHFGVSHLINRKKIADPSLFYLIIGLVLTFITIAIPVQLNGNWVSLLWAAEAAILFWIGRTKAVAIYEKLAYILVFLAFFSQVQDWSTFYIDNKFTPILNGNFINGAIFTAIFGFITFINQDKRYATSVNTASANTQVAKLMQFLLPCIFIGSLYFIFKFEINGYWRGKSHSLEMAGGFEHWLADYQQFNFIWQLNYTLFFLTALSFFNIKKLQNRLLSTLNIYGNLIVLGVFISLGLIAFHELRDSYLSTEIEKYQIKGGIYIIIRYISYIFAASTFVATYQYIRQEFTKPHQFNYLIAFELIMYGAILCVASSELLNILNLLHVTQSDKLGLSIFWGIYALALIALGIWQGKQYLRLSAIILFAITLLKLFFYDIASLNTIAKTVVFVSLGLLLLIISFLYNKYKHLITDDEAK